MKYVNLIFVFLIAAYGSALLGWSGGILLATPIERIPEVTPLMAMVGVFCLMGAWGLYLAGYALFCLDDKGEPVDG